MDLRLNTGYRQIFRMAFPISLAILVPQVNFITNNIFLGQLGEHQFASAGITGVYYLIFAVIGNGLNNGLQVLISRRAGQNLPKEIGRLFYHGVWVALGVAILGIVITYSIAPAVLRATLRYEDIADEVISFLLVRIWGLPILYLYIMRNALLVGTNQTRFLIWGALSETITNIVLDYGLIYGNFGLPRMGFQGGAYASILAEATGLLVIYAIIHAKRIHKTFSFFEQTTFDASIFKLILVQSSPLVAQYGISILTWEYFYILVEHHGPMALAISNTMRNIFGVFGVFAWAFASTANSMVSNVLGQGRADDVMPLVYRIAGVSFLIGLLTFSVLNIYPEWFLSFYKQKQEFIITAVPVVRIVSGALLLMSFGSVWLNAVTGTGNTVVNLLIELITIIVYGIYVYLVLEHWNMSITWGWMSEWLYWICMLSMAYLYMRSNRWRGKKI